MSDPRRSRIPDRTSVTGSSRHGRRRTGTIEPVGDLLDRPGGEAEASQKLSMTRKRQASGGLAATVIGGVMANHRQKRQAEHEMQLAQMAHAAEAQRFQSLQTVGQLYALRSDEFERVVGSFLVAQGFVNVTQVGRAGDLAADLTAVDPWGRTVAVQCKRKAIDQKVGSPELQKFVGMVHAYHRAHYGIFVTTSTFSQPAIGLARAAQIVLWDAHYLAHLMAVQARQAAQATLEAGPPVSPDGQFWWDGAQWRPTYTS